MSPWRCVWGGLAAVLVFAATAFGQEPEIPRLTQRVTDLSGTLDRSEVLSLEEKLAGFERSTSTQIVVVLLASLEGGSIEDVSMRVAERNGIGQKGKDNGVLLLIAKSDRRVRIEVGYGLEGVLTDALTGQIIRKEIAPFFKQGRYYEGIDAGIEAIMLATRNEYQSDGGNEGGSRGLNPFLVLFLVLLFGFLRAGGLRRRGLTGGMGPIFRGGAWGGSSDRGDGVGVADLSVAEARVDVGRQK